ncbi:MAG: aldo/keto reductase [Acidimicrobiales bacterium]|jgi:aryl-alcohol dehydrogenase-like predicted oxidoreductase
MVAGSGTMQLGSLTVHRLGFGTMRLTGRGIWGPPRDHDEAISVLRRAVVLGVDLFDTADSYGPHVAEELIREALHPYPPQLKIATKAGFTRSGPDRWKVKGEPQYLRRQCEGSLRRLGVEQIDLFQLHRVDPRVPAAEQYGLLKALRDEGKVREVGLSEVNGDQIDEALAIVPLVSVQNQYHVAQRGADDVIDHCERHQLGFMPWGPLASGKLADPGGPLDRLAHELGATVPQVGLAWLLRRSPVMLPIPGTSTLAHLEENCAAADITLSDAQFEELNEARRPLRRWVMQGGDGS